MGSTKSSSLADVNSKDKRKCALYDKISVCYFSECRET